MTKTIPPQSMPKTPTSERESLDQCELLLRELLSSEAFGIPPELHDRIRMLLGCIAITKDPTPSTPRDLWQALCTAESALRFLLSPDHHIHIVGHDASEAVSRVRYALLWIAQSKCPGDTNAELADQGGES